LQDLIFTKISIDALNSGLGLENLQQKMKYVHGICFILIFITISYRYGTSIPIMGVRRGGKEGGFALLRPAKNSMSFNFFVRKIMSFQTFLDYYYVYAPSPLENFALPWKKVCGRQ